MISINRIPVYPGNFPDGTLNLKLTEKNPITIQWNYENDAELFTIICIRKHYANFPLYLYMPYIPHARMDRVKHSEDVFTLKYFADIINSLNFKEVIVLDPHSNVSLALFDRIVVRDVSDHIYDAILAVNSRKSEPILFYPDEGAMKRYSEMIKGYNFSFGIKNRDWTTGKIQGLILMNDEEVVDRDVLIVDDICSRGGTFYHSAKALYRAGAKSVSLYVTHCENTVLTGDLFKENLIDCIYTTKSLVHVPELKSKLIYV